MIELDLVTDFPHEIVAVDEVGRGPLCGPVVIGAVRVFVPDQSQLRELLIYLKHKKINDSKKIRSLERLKIIKELGINLLEYRSPGKVKIQSSQVSYITWEMDHDVIDQENILAATLRGMKEAALELSKTKKQKTTVLIDGNKKFNWLEERPIWREVPIVKGDQKSLLIGLASIIAKEKRDAFMKDMHELYPQYDFGKNFGYPTKRHRMAIEKYGPCSIHRKTFSGVKEFIRTNSRD